MQSALHFSSLGHTPPFTSLLFAPSTPLSSFYLTLRLKLGQGRRQNKYTMESSVVALSGGFRVYIFSLTYMGKLLGMQLGLGKVILSSDIKI